MFEQLANLYRGLSTARRASLLGVALALGGGLTWLATQPSRMERVPVQAGRKFSGLELAVARKQLAAAQISDYDVSAGQILVPAADAARFDAALAEEPGTTGWAGAWQQANDSLSPFASGRQQHDAREIARARLISELLQQLPDVEQAQVVWDEEPRVGWRQPPRVRATVYLQPRERREITLDTVDAVRRAVAGSKAHLDPADVVVMDLRRMTAYGQQPDTAGSGLAEPRLAALTAACRRRIEDALADFEGVHVAVIVEETKAPALTSVGRATTAATAAVSSVVQQPRRAADGPSGPRGGPNQRLAVDPSPPDAPTPVIAEASAAVNPSPTTAPETVRAIVSLPPDYVRDRAIERDTPAAFARRTPAEQQALLTELERTIVQDIRERVARIIPGTTQADVVEVQMHETRITAASLEGRPTFGAARSALATFARWDRPTQWAVGGLIGYLLLWQLVRAFRHRRLMRRPPQAPVRPTDGPVIGLDSARRHPPEPPDDADLSPHEQAQRLLARLNDADPSEWRFELAGIPPDVIGALLPRLEPDRVTSVMAALSPAAQQQALAHLAGLGPSDKPSRPLAEPLRRVAPETAPLSGDPADLDELDDTDPSLLRTLFARLPGEVWSTALMGASAAFRVRLLSALPAADAAALRQSLTRQRPARLRDIETAQQQVLDLLHDRGAFP